MRELTQQPMGMARFLTEREREREVAGIQEARSCSRLLCAYSVLLNKLDPSALHARVGACTSEREKSRAD